MFSQSFFTCLFFVVFAFTTNADIKLPAFFYRQHGIATTIASGYMRMGQAQYRCECYRIVEQKNAQCPYPALRCFAVVKSAKAVPQDDCRQQETVFFGQNGSGKQ